MKNRLKFAVLMGLGMCFAGVSACSSTVDEVKDEVDCTQVCKRYADCVNNDYDVSACQDKCEADADDSQARRDKLRACDDCLDDKSCTGSLVCADECAGII